MVMMGNNIYLTGLNYHQTDKHAFFFRLLQENLITMKTEKKKKLLSAAAAYVSPTVLAAQHLHVQNNKALSLRAKERAEKQQQENRCTNDPESQNASRPGSTLSSRAGNGTRNVSSMWK